jgi:hypothetical protein
MSDYREVHEQAREHGLKARQATRHERAIRRQVAEEIAQAIEVRRIMDGRQEPEQYFAGRYSAFDESERIAREIGSKETS